MRDTKTTSRAKLCTVAIKGTADPYPCCGDPVFMVEMSGGRVYFACRPHLGWALESEEDLPAIIRRADEEVTEH